MQMLILFQIITVFLVVLLIYIKIKLKKIELEVKDTKKNFSNKERELKYINEKLENKLNERDYRFTATNLLVKSLAKERNIKTLKTLILDMLKEINQAEGALSLTRLDDTLYVDEKLGLKGNDYFKINDSLDKEFLAYLKENRVSSFEELKKFEIFTDIYNSYENGVLLSFYVSKDSMSDRLEYMVILKKDKDFCLDIANEEFLRNLVNQVELIYENAMRHTYIGETNDKLKERLFDLTAVNSAIKMVTSTFDLNDVFKMSTDIIQEVARAKNSSIVYYDKIDSTLEVKAVSGVCGEVVIGEKIEILPEDIADFNEDTEIVILTDVFDFNKNGITKFYSKYKKFFRKLRGEVIIPLAAKGELNGFLIIGMKFADDGYKEEDKELFSTIASQIGVAISNANLYNMAITDGMTKLYLHRYFKTRLEEELSRSKRYKNKFSFLMTDIDHFKNFNDTYGHQVGDDVLKLVANIVKESVRQSDIPARYGGEEFAVILPETLKEGALATAEHIRKKIANYPFEVNGESVKITISIGISIFNGDRKELTMDELIKEADDALYFAKENGRNKSVLYDEIVR